MVTRTKKIFVGGLSAPTTLEDVKSYFEQFGPVSVKKWTGSCLAFAKSNAERLGDLLMVSKPKKCDARGLCH